MKLSYIFSLAITFTLASTTVSFAQSSAEKTEIAASFKTLNTKVKGITCSSDLKTISANVEKLEGVNACIAGKTGPTTKFEIAYDPALVSEQDIVTAIQNTAGCEDPNDRPYKVKQ